MFSFFYLDNIFYTFFFKAERLKLKKNINGGQFEVDAVDFLDSNSATILSNLKLKIFGYRGQFAESFLPNIQTVRLAWEKDKRIIKTNRKKNDGY